MKLHIYGFRRPKCFEQICALQMIESALHSTYCNKEKYYDGTKSCFSNGPNHICAYKRKAAVEPTFS